MNSDWPFYLAGQWERSDESLPVTNPYDGSVVGTTYRAPPEQLERAIVAAEKAFPITRNLASYQREEILLAAARGIEERSEELARLLAQEAGKPIRDATAEVNRSVFTFRVAAEECKRIGGDVIPLDWMAASKGRFAITRRYPIGPVAGVSPFNFPLNLAAHKVAPAIAVGNPLVLKPPSDCPLTMLAVSQIIDKTGLLPAGALSVLPMSRPVGDRLVPDERLKLLTFTGSPAVGWDMKKRAGSKRVVLELGGNAGVIVDRDANLDYAVPRSVFGSFAYAGQICISIQRIFVQRDIFDEFSSRFIEATRRLKVGDPLEPETEMGPIISDSATERIQSWLDEAVAGGVKLLTGGERQGRLMQPTVLLDTPRDFKISCLEAFAPVVNLQAYDDFADALALVNDSIYGLQAGVFTGTLEHALAAFDGLEVGGVVLNDVPTYRIDHMPYGGVKSSGLGREGLKYAIEDHTEMRLLVVNRP